MLNIHLSICSTGTFIRIDYSTILKFRFNIDQNATYNIVLVIVFQMA